MSALGSIFGVESRAGEGGGGGARRRRRRVHSARPDGDQTSPGGRRTDTGHFEKKGEKQVWPDRGGRSKEKVTVF